MQQADAGVSLAYESGNQKLIDDAEKQLALEKEKLKVLEEQSAAIKNRQAIQPVQSYNVDAARQAEQAAAGQLQDSVLKRNELGASIFEQQRGRADELQNAQREAVRGISFQTPLTIEAARNFFVSSETGIEDRYTVKTDRTTYERVITARQFLAAGTTKVTLNVKLSEQPCYHMGYQSLTTVPMTLNFNEAGELLGFNIDAPAELKYVAMFDIWIAK